MYKYRTINSNPMRNAITIEITYLENKYDFAINFLNTLLNPVMTLKTSTAMRSHATTGNYKFL
jgi:hypothetical protein